MNRKEKKYRVNIIQEHHYNKSEQRILDDYKVKYGVTYKKIYSVLKAGKNLSFQAVIASDRAARAACRLGGTAEHTAKGLLAFAKAIPESEVFGYETR